MTEALPERALSIRQPWVWAILNAGKRIENRPRRFNYRGPICLHASMTMGRDEISSYRWCAGDVAAWHSAKAFAREVLIIGTAEIVDCIEQSDDPWFFGPFGLVLKNVQPVPFIPVKGALGLFRWQPLIT